jgi:hypothetical protein
LNKQEFVRQFEENVAYLRRNVPPDDIYLFAEQLFMGAMFFLMHWNEHEDVTEVCQYDKIADRFIKNIAGLYHRRKEGQEAVVNLNFHGLSDE